MINGLEGIPGSGKSYEAVVFHVLHALKGGRLVVTNLPLLVQMFAAIDPRYADLIELRSVARPVLGTWDATRVDDKGNGNAFRLWLDEAEQRSHEKSQIITDGRTAFLRSGRKSIPVFGHVWDYYHEWKHPTTGSGPLFVIDECHVPLPRLGTDPEVIEWYKLHRHFNVDVLLMTQKFRGICADIADLMAMLVRCRKADFLGKPDHYVRKVYAGYRGALVSDEQRKYEPQYFPLYKSHTQGNSVAESLASDVEPFIVKWKRITRIWWAGFFVLCVLFVVWKWGGKPEGPKAAKSKPGHAVAASLPERTPTVSSAVRPDVVAAKLEHSEPASEDDPEPFAGRGVHLKGRLTLGSRTIYLFVVSQNGQVVQSISDGELQGAGYTFKPTGDCTGVLSWKSRARPVSCDLPTVNVPATGA